MSQQAVRFSALFVRVTLGTCFVFHSWPKVTGLFDGSTASNMESMGLTPALPIGIAVALGELLAGLALIMGVFHKVAAFGVIVIMIGAIWTVTGKHGYSNQNGGFEYNLALIALAVSVFCVGPGAYAFKIKRADK